MIQLIFVVVWDLQGEASLAKYVEIVEIWSHNMAAAILWLHILLLCSYIIKD